jgi:hypothetical protein
MNLRDLTGITTYQDFKQRLIDFNNWRSNISEDEESRDEMFIKHIQKSYRAFLQQGLSDITVLDTYTDYQGKQTDHTLGQFCSFILYCNL